MPEKRNYDPFNDSKVFSKPDIVNWQNFKKSVPSGGVTNTKHFPENQNKISNFNYAKYNNKQQKDISSEKLQNNENLPVQMSRISFKEDQSLAKIKKHEFSSRYDDNAHKLQELVCKVIDSKTCRQNILPKSDSKTGRNSVLYSKLSNELYSSQPQSLKSPVSENLTASYLYSTLAKPDHITSFPSIKTNSQNCLPKTDHQNTCNKLYSNFLGECPNVSSTLTASAATKQIDINEKENEIKLVTERAMKEGKVFTCNGPYPTLRLSLRKRGWVEKFTNFKENLLCIPRSAIFEEDKDLTPHTRSEESSRLAKMSTMVKSTSPTFMFTVKTSDILAKSLKNNQIVNHFGRATAFTTKVGLLQSLKDAEWFGDRTADSFFPRCYNLSKADDKQAFIDDYNLTSCMALLKHFVDQHENEQCNNGTDVDRPDRQPKESSAHSSEQVLSHLRKRQEEKPELSFLPSIQSASHATVTEQQLQNVTLATPYSSSISILKPQKHVSMRAVRFALDRCIEYIDCCEHKDLVETDSMNGINKKSQVKEKHWKDFLEAYKFYVNNKMSMDKRAVEYLSECRKVLLSMEQSWPQYDLDGILNVWILKPGAKSRGRGIQCSNNLTEIFTLCSNNNSSLVAQKYIEKPMLIYNTKFDLRQWFLVTDWNPLTMWFYGDAYLRFCSREFTLENFHESIHLSNNSVQKNYTPSSERSSHLPADNMWTSDEFKSFLKLHDKEESWDSIIVPGMKECILDVLLCTQDSIDHRKGSFELFGADFMLTEDLKPWLIEINSSPSMARTTKATEILVKKVLEDTVKVVIDRRSNQNCDTGKFELAYKQVHVYERSATDTVQPLLIVGKKIQKFLKM